ncbi:unnamed protein product [Bemisia tabaci]|uniref:glutathione-specific gamma-glutamylcyclotransferase n=1 Tax=Bemisia tabaci TaxID=7038 RepID=A0A9P0ACN7_BEMTA|nr:unnamed protein product [Bemisia tabaci]
MEQAESANPQVWVFGYGSLCWHPGFEYDEAVTGYIKGYTRKFWQGSANHRGTSEKPGRVATLVDEKEGIVWGRAFKLTGDLALHYLNDRECKLGGYTTLHLDFYPKPDALLSDSTDSISTSTSTSSEFSSTSSEISASDSSSTGLSSATTEHSTSNSTTVHSTPSSTEGSETTAISVLNSASSSKPFKALVFIATPANDLWLGEAPLNDIADHIVGCKGQSGYNVEYVLRLAHFMHEHIPEAKDNHLFTLEYLLLNKIEAANLCLNEMMGTKATAGSAGSSRGTTDTALPAPPQASYQFSARVPSKKLRCLNI